MKRVNILCSTAERVAFLHAVLMATVIMCRVRNPACTAASVLEKENFITG